MTDIKTLEQNLKYTFKDPGILENALIHPSYVNEKQMARMA